MHQPLALLALLARLLRHAAQPASRHAAAAAAAAADGTRCILLELIQRVEELVAVLVGGLCRNRKEGEWQEKRAERRCRQAVGFSTKASWVAAVVRAWRVVSCGDRRARKGCEEGREGVCGGGGNHLDVDVGVLADHRQQRVALGALRRHISGANAA